MKFLVCPVPGVRIKSDWMFDNNPVAVSAVRGLSRGRVNHYNNETGFPSIKFTGTEFEWVFDKLSHREVMFAMLAAGEEQPTLQEMIDAAAWDEKGLVAAKTHYGRTDWREIPIGEAAR